MSNQTYESFRGTARQFIAAGVKINGHPVDDVGLSIMQRYGIAKVVGTAEKPANVRGRAPSIFEVRGKSGFKVEVTQKETEKAVSA